MTKRPKLRFQQLEMKSNIPWVHGYEWEKMLQATTTAVASLGTEEISQFKEIASDIANYYKGVAIELDVLAARSCAFCEDSCCERATVWYDLKDLLYIYFYTGDFPSRQIYRREGTRCCNLELSGCQLHRTLRPFICTWYLCAVQKNILQQSSARPITLTREIEKIKLLRKKLGRLFLSQADKNTF